MISSPHTAPLPSRREPKQRRSKALVESICQACMEIIEAGRGEELSVSLIVKTAGVTVSSFYQYFQNLDAVMAATLSKYDRYEPPEFTIQKLTGTLGTLSINQAIEFLVDFICDRHLYMLDKYGQVYRRFHRCFSAQLLSPSNADNDNNPPGLEAAIQCFFEENCEFSKIGPIKIAAFITTSAIVDIPGRLVDIGPSMLEDKKFRKSLKSLFINFLDVTERPKAPFY